MESVKPGADFPSLEEDVLKKWREQDTFQESLRRREKEPRYMFYDGPPFATGTPHYGHLLAGTIKDIVPRYWSMRGYSIDRRFGWDTHGLPIEMLTEKELGLAGREEIVEYGVDKFNEACRSGVLRYVEDWRETTERLGRWVDFDRDYKTMDLSFMDSVWWVFRQLWEQGRIYEGARVVPYSWRLSTPLSNFEASSNYKEVQDPAVTVKFERKDQPGTFFLAWTTTPWTLPSNLGLCVGAKIRYIEVSHGSERYILAEALRERVFGSKASLTIEKEYLGSDLKNIEYIPPFPFFSSVENAFRVLVDDYVTTEDGTGIVHQSPAHGEDDYRVGNANGLPLVDPVDDEGKFTELVPPFQGLNIKDADKKIITALKENGSLFKQETIQHSYPFCERSDTPLIYKAISAWYVKVEDLRQEMSENNQEIHWVPEHIKDGRFGKWIAQARDWNISRNRFWGNPLPIWRCSACGDLQCLGSSAELEEKCGEAVPDLHKHFVDRLSWSCSECTEGEMKRVPEVLDCWFESGSMPYAQLHYPFENEELFETSFPADFIAEGLDQTRGWFYTLMVLSSALFQKAPFKNVVVNGMILAEDGKKMSKRLKNYPDPRDVIDQYGADALRLYMISSAVVRGESLRFSENGVKEIVRSVLIPFWNVYSFFTTYAQIDEYVPSSDLTASDNILDRWIISRFQTLVRRIEAEMAQYRLYAVIPALLEFLEELTNWYLRRSRRRFWSEDPQDKQLGYDTLLYILTEFSKVLAPFLPFITERIYENLKSLEKNPLESIHFADYPTPLSQRQDEALESDMKLIQLVVNLGRSLRAHHDIKLRQPLNSITVITKDEAAKGTLERHAQHVREELNVKEVIFRPDESSFVELEVRPNFKLLGPIFGKEMKQCAAELKKLPDDQISQLESGGEITILGRTLSSSEIEIRRTPIDGQEVETAAGVTVLFDTEITGELRSEGLSRELINRIQRLRKEADLQVSDRIRTEIAAPAEFLDQIAPHEGLISGETLSDQFLKLSAEAPSGTHTTEGEIESFPIQLGISVISPS
ncbi:isoleucine--tRNA ligase [bacterium]|nr:isoleucine--tRNA ligase [bacterium]